MIGRWLSRIARVGKNCASCDEMARRPVTELCTSLRPRFTADVVLLPNGNGGGAEPAMPSRWVEEVKRNEEGIGRVFYLAPPDAPIPSIGVPLRMPPLRSNDAAMAMEGRLHRCAELSEQYIIMPTVCLEENTIDLLGFFTVNGLPLLYRNGGRCIDPHTLPFPPAHFAEAMIRSGTAMEQSFRPVCGPYGTNKELSRLAERFIAHSPGVDAASPETYRFILQHLACANRLGMG